MKQSGGSISIPKWKVKFSFIKLNLNYESNVPNRVMYGCDVLILITYNTLSIISSNASVTTTLHQKRSDQRSDVT